jgi:hypothetical protein
MCYIDGRKNKYLVEIIGLSHGKKDEEAGHYRTISRKEG